MNERRSQHPASRVGRGATRNPAPRFLPVVREVTSPADATCDGWGTADEAPPPLRTVVTAERTRSILSRNDSPDVPFDVSINPYKGCEHGCVYCFARPTHAYLDLSPGLDFESRIVSKPEGPARLREAFSKRGYRPEPIALGANTDPYQPVERELGITRALLEVFRDFRHPVSIVTKGQLVLRDVDLLGELARDGLASVFVSVTSLDRTLARKMEPRAAAPERRLDAIAGLSGAGVPVGVLAAPMIPALNDHELERILEACHAAGARQAGYVFLRLPLEIKELFEGWLEEHFPARKARVLGLVRDARGGKLYDPEWGTRMRGTGPYAALLERRFAAACARLGFTERSFTLRTDLFRVPAAASAQLSLW
jgi:DNA repair photolyase